MRLFSNPAWKRDIAAIRRELDAISEEVARMAATLDDVKVVADRLVQDVGKMIAVQNALLEKLAGMALPPDAQPVVNELGASADAIEAALANAQKELAP